MPRFFEPGSQRATKVNELFTKIAPRYDLINDLQSFGLHRYWKRRLIRLAAPRAGLQALDVCCGTGDLALALARKGAEVVGIDFSERMLQVARRKAQRSKRRLQGRPGDSRPEGPRPRDSTIPQPASEPQLSAPRVDRSAPPSAFHANPRFVQADALKLPFADNSFDLVTIGYGLRNLASLETGLREMQRVARPGGRILSLDFGKPDNRLWRSVYFGYLRFFVPWLGRVFVGDAGAYAYILKSLMHYPAQRGVADCMRQLGLGNVGIVSLLGGIMSINYGEKRAS